MKNAEGEKILVPEGQNKIWNYHPDLPVPNSPVFRWRPRVWFVLNWFRRGWLALSGATIWVALAFGVFTWLQPELNFFRGLNLSNIAAVGITIALIGVVVWKYYNEREDR